MNRDLRCAAVTFLAAGLWASGCSVADRQYGAAAGETSTGGDSGSGSGSGIAPLDCSAPYVLMCEDFESLEAQMAPSGKLDTYTENGAVVVDSTKAFSGAQSVKVSTKAGSAVKSASIRYSAGLPVSGNVLFGRMMFFLESVPETDTEWAFINAVGKIDDPTEPYTVDYRMGGQLPIVDGDGMFIGSQLTATYETPESYNNPPVGPATNCWQHADKKVAPVGQWACAEWEFDGMNNEVMLWMNGAKEPVIHVKGMGEGCKSQDANNFTWTAPPFSDLYLGWESYLPDEARAMWIDDLAIGTERLGCP